MSGIQRRLTQLEAIDAAGRLRVVFRPDAMSPEPLAAWLAELREREGWGAADKAVVIRSWLPDAMPSAHSRVIV
jgi:hypothetical protein